MKSALKIAVFHTHSDAVRLVRMLEDEGDIRVVWQSPFAVAHTVMGWLTPDLVLLDAAGASEIPALVRYILDTQPVPIAVIGEVDERLRHTLSTYALELLSWPTAANATEEALLRRRLRLLAQVAVVRVRNRAGQRRRAGDRDCPVVGIVGSTGGPEALSRLLPQLEGLGAAVIVVQHLHPAFAETFIEWLQRSSPLPVAVAAEGDPLVRGRVYVSPAGLHCSLSDTDHIVLSAEPPSLHCPSANVLLHSLAKHAGRRAIGVILSGMGDDGADGLAALHRAGGLTIVQDEATCVVFGMGKAAVERGAAAMVLPLSEIGSAVRDQVEGAAVE